MLPGLSLFPSVVLSFSSGLVVRSSSFFLPHAALVLPLYHGGIPQVGTRVRTAHADGPRMGERVRPLRASKSTCPVAPVPPTSPVPPAPPPHPADLGHGAETCAEQGRSRQGKPMLSLTVVRAGRALREADPRPTARLHLPGQFAYVARQQACRGLVTSAPGGPREIPSCGRSPPLPGDTALGGRSTPRPAALADNP